MITGGTLTVAGAPEIVKDTCAICDAPIGTWRFAGITTSKEEEVLKL